MDIEKESPEWKQMRKLGDLFVKYYEYVKKMQDIELEISQQFKEDLDDISMALFHLLTHMTSDEDWVKQEISKEYIKSDNIDISEDALKTETDAEETGDKHE